MAIVRVRQHVNPLSRKYQQPVNPPRWETIFAKPDQPLHLDVGCGRGQFLLSMAQRQSEWNFLGLEIREPLVGQADLWRDELGLTNLYYLFCNVSSSLHPILDSLSPGTLQRVTIQFPDPWFKKRHQKRRVVQPELVENLAEHLAGGGIVLIQSDVEAVAVEMSDRFQSHPAFTQQGTERWLPTNPLPIPTEREQFVMAQGLPVYRAVFVKRPHESKSAR